MATNGEKQMEERLVDPPRLGLLRDDEAEEEEQAAIGGVAGLVDRCGSLTLAGGIEGGGFKFPGLVAEGGGANRRMGSGAGLGDEEGGHSAGPESGGSVLSQGFGLYVTVRMWREFSPKTHLRLNEKAPRLGLIRDGDEIEEEEVAAGGGGSGGAIGGDPRGVEPVTVPSLFPGWMPLFCRSGFDGSMDMVDGWLHVHHDLWMYGFVEPWCSLYGSSWRKVSCVQYMGVTCSLRMAWWKWRKRLEAKGANPFLPPA